MNKRTRILYWVATLWLSLGMVSTGIVQIMRVDEEVDMMTHLGYPVYFMVLLGLTKIAGVIVLLLPRLPILKEWAYAGFFFTLAGAVISHGMSADPFAEMFPPLLLMLLTFGSWYLRPPDRKPGRPLPQADPGS